MTIDVAAILLKNLAGVRLVEVVRREYDWTFDFSSGASIATPGPWRLLISDGIAVCDEDHNQKFGLPAPMNAAQRALDLIGHSPIKSVSLRDGVMDLSIQFEGKILLEFFNMSCGYEGWNFGSGELRVIARGGGDLAIMGLHK